MLSPTASNVRDSSIIPIRSYNNAPSTPPPKRPHHLLHRSVSEISPPTRREMEREGGGGLRIPHPHLHRHRDRPDKEHHLPLLDTRSEVNLAHNGVTSRRASIVREDGVAERMAFLGLPTEWKPISAEEVKATKAKNSLRKATLQKTLQEMNELGLSTTRRLDNTYYSILERLSHVLGTIQGLKELAIMSRNLSEEFSDEASTITEELNAQLDAFNSFNEQKQKIQQLEERVHKGRDRVKSLSTRVKAVSEKIVIWENLEGQWQSRMRYRLKIVWGVLAALMILGFVLGWWYYTPSRIDVTKSGTMRGFQMRNSTVDISEAKEVLLNETWALKRKASDALEALRKRPDDAVIDDPVLRAFDEL